MTVIAGVILLTACENSGGESADSGETSTMSNEAEMKNGGNTETSYNADLASELGADPYGMKQYVMAFLKKGPNRDRPAEEAAALQRAHLDNIGRLAEEGKLLIAGPFMDDGDPRGIYIFDVRSIEEAEALTNTDPAIQQGQLVMELRMWYGSAGLMKVGEFHKMVAKESV